MKSFIKSKWFYLSLLIVSISAFFVYETKTSHKADTTKKIFTVTSSDILQRVTVTGKIIPKRQTIISASYDGYIKKIFVHVGQAVKAGDAIVSIVPSLQNTQEVYPIRAPYDGIVVHIQRTEGEFVKASDVENYIVRIDDLNQLFVSADVPEMDIVKIKLGQIATIKATPILNKTYKGIVREIALSAKQQQLQMFSNAQNQYPIKIEISNKDQELKPGMSTIIDIIAHEYKNVITLPHEFINKKDNKYFVTLENGTKKNVHIGVQNDMLVEIVSGVQVGEQIRQVDYLENVEG